MEEFASIFHLVVPSPDSRSVLADMREENPRLPQVAAPKTHGSPWVTAWNRDTDLLCPIIAHYFHSGVYVRRPLWFRSDPPPGSEEVVLVVDLIPHLNSCIFVMPPGFRWLPREAALQASWAQLHANCNIADLLTLFFEDLNAGGPASRAPWRKINWFRDMSTWVKSLLKEHNLKPLGELEQCRNMFQSSVLRCKVRTAPSAPPGNLDFSRNTDGHIYVKTTIPSFPEATVTGALSSLMEAFVPKVLAKNKDNFTFVQLGAEAGWDLEPSAVMKALAKMHLESLQRIEDLKSAGVPDRGLEWLSANITTILEGPLFRLCHPNRHLLELQSRAGEIEELCDILMDFRLPHTLVHGDCNMTNVCVGLSPGSTVSFIDWADCCIAYPLYDYIRITQIGFEAIVDENARDCYLNQWLPFERREKILEATVLALPLMLCTNLFEILRMCLAVEPIERPLLLSGINRRMPEILDALNEASSLRRVSDDIFPNNRYHFIVPHHSGEMILTSFLDGQPGLPFVSSPLPGTSLLVFNWDKDPHRLRVMLGNSTGCDCCIVKPVQIWQGAEPGVEEAVLAAELLGGDVDLPNGFEWMPVCNLSSLQWRPIHGDVDPVKTVGSFFTNTVAGVTQLDQQPWRSLGWFQDAIRWVEAALSETGLSLASPIRQERTTFQSALLSCTVQTIDTEGFGRLLEGSDTIYIKASMPHFAESKVSLEISSFSCGVMPKIIAFSEERNIFIQEDAGFLEESDFNVAELMKCLAELQLRSMSHLDELKQCGISVYNSDWVSANAASVLSHALLDLCKDRKSVLELRLRISEIERYAQELIEFGVPVTLVHGDFHDANVGGRRPAGGYYILDWGSCFIGHPFCDFAVMSTVAQDLCFDLEAAEEAYFSFWGQYGTQPELRRAVRLALVHYWVINLNNLIHVYDYVDVVEKGYIRELLEDSVSFLTRALNKAVRDK